MIKGVIAGAFDLGHPGILLTLQDAKKKCDILTFLLHADPSRENPLKNKPVETVYERYVRLNSCRYVNRVFSYDTEEDLFNILVNYDWDIRFLGEDYKGKKEFTGCSLDIPIHYISRQHNYSSTNLRRRVALAQYELGKERNSKDFEKKFWKHEYDAPYSEGTI